MILKYDMDISSEAIVTNLQRLINQTYKLLPHWEEGIDWKKPLTTIIEEFAGMDRLFLSQQEIFAKVAFPSEKHNIFCKICYHNGWASLYFGDIPLAFRDKI